MATRKKVKIPDWTAFIYPGHQQRVLALAAANPRAMATAIRFCEMMLEVDPTMRPGTADVAIAAGVGGASTIDIVHENYPASEIALNVQLSRQFSAVIKANRAFIEMQNDSVSTVVDLDSDVRTNPDYDYDYVERPRRHLRR